MFGCNPSSSYWKEIYLLSCIPYQLELPAAIIQHVSSRPSNSAPDEPLKSRSQTATSLLYICSHIQEVALYLYTTLMIIYCLLLVPSQVQKRRQWQCYRLYSSIILIASQLTLCNTSLTFISHQTQLQKVKQRQIPTTKVQHHLQRQERSNLSSHFRLVLDTRPPDSCVQLLIKTL